MEQLDFPFPLDKKKLTAFLTQWCAIENEEDRLREEKRLLKEEYVDDFPMRGLLVAVKIVRARVKLETHAKEPMQRVHLEYLEALVDQHLRGVQAALDAMTVTLTTGEVQSVY